MSTVQGFMLSLLIAVCNLMCSAQNATIPFRQIEREARISAHLNVPDSEAALNRSYESSPTLSSASGFVYGPPSYKQPRVFNSKFVLINGLHLGMAAFDVGMTQHCIANHHCREGNPLMPSSLAGQLGVDSALVGYGTFISYRLKKQDSKIWWLSPVVGIAAHTAGVATGFVNR